LNIKLAPRPKVVLLTVPLIFCSVFDLVVHHIPGPTGFRDLHCSDIERDFPRAEGAFLKYIGTSRWLEDGTDPEADESSNGAPLPELPPTNDQLKALDHQHDYEIIVGKMPLCGDFLKKYH
jgi:hypothetical protein